MGKRRLGQRQARAQRISQDGRRVGASGHDKGGGGCADDGNGAFRAQPEAFGFDHAHGPAAASAAQFRGERAAEGRVAVRTKAALELFAAFFADEDDIFPGRGNGLDGVGHGFKMGSVPLLG